MGSWISSQQLHGTSGWQKVGFYVKVDQGADTVLACRLGFYSALNAGKAFFRDLSVSKVDAPASDGDPRFDLDTDSPLPAS
jgi:hypothetical protein